MEVGRPMNFLQGIPFGGSPREINLALDAALGEPHSCPLRGVTISLDASDDIELRNSVPLLDDRWSYASRRVLQLFLAQRCDARGVDLDELERRAAEIGNDGQGEFASWRVSLTSEQHQFLASCPLDPRARDFFQRVGDRSMKFEVAQMEGARYFMKAGKVGPINFKAITSLDRLMEAFVDALGPRAAEFRSNFGLELVKGLTGPTTAKITISSIETPDVIKAFFQWAHCMIMCQHLRWSGEWPMVPNRRLLCLEEFGAYLPQIASFLPQQDLVRRFLEELPEGLAFRFIER